MTVAEVRVKRTGSVAVLTLANAPLNPLSSALVEQLWVAFTTAIAEPAVHALVLVGDNDTFVAGADIRRLEALVAARPGDDPQRAHPPPPAGETAGQHSAPATAGAPSLSELITRLELSDKPIVAAVDGFALGGGLELSMGCHARVATPSAKLGLPELKLGLIPGAGGTQRLPRLIGLEVALDLMLSSRQLASDEARELGLVDEISPRQQLLERAIELAEALAQQGAAALRRSSQLKDKLGAGPDLETSIDAARQRFQRLFSRGLRYPELCLDAVACGVVDGSGRGLVRERECFEECLQQEAARGLIHLFFAQRSAGKVPGVTDVGLEARRFARSAVIGGGTMGAGISAALLASRFEVILIERDANAAAAAQARLAAILGADLAKGRVDQAEHDARLGRLRTSTSLADLSQTQLVIEAATEDLELKRDLFEQLLQICPADTLLATNTSTLPLERIAEGLDGGERILGAHFFSPAHIMPLVEVVRSQASSPQLVMDLLGVVRALRKTPVVVGSCVGFLVNRVFMPYGQAVGLLIDRGHDPYHIDRVMLDFGMPMGPCRVSDLAGVDVGVFAGQILDAAYPERAYRSPLRRLLVAAGRLGEKAGVGHYRYVDKRAQEDPELASFVAASRAEMGDPTPLGLSDDDVLQLLLFVVVNEACRVLDEGHVLRPSDVDLALQLGMGFPGFRGGPMKWADQFGARHVARRLVEWQALTGSGLFQVCEGLGRRAERDQSLLDA